MMKYEALGALTFDVRCLKFEVRDKGGLRRQ